MSNTLSFSQLWPEEESYLKKISQNFTGNIMAVEIGTAQGGSSYILCNNAKNADLKIHSFDIAPSKEAYDHLKDMNVVIHAMPSVEGAINWPQLCGEDIDFIFIDGGHHLDCVFNDFSSWFPKMKDKSMILFHDFDPVRRGGFPHLGVYVLIEALKKQGILDDIQHIGRMFSGIKTGECNFEKLENDCLDVFQNWLNATKNSTLTFETGLDIYRNIIQAEDNQNTPITESEFYYLLKHYLSTDRNSILEKIKDRKSFFKWEEVLFMLEHSVSTSNKNPTKIHELSQRIAHELVRMNILQILANNLIH
jgi:methyltransferase family protein